MEFLGLEFSAFEIGKQELLEPFLKQYPQSISGYTFASLASWNPVYSYHFCFLDKTTLLIAFIDQEGKKALLQPLGAFPKKHQALLLKSIKREPCGIAGVSEEFLLQNQVFCSHFTVQEDRKMANYEYRALDLATLKGRRYDKKRNLIHQAEKLYKWEARPLLEDCKRDCCRILSDILLEEQDLSKENQDELKALDFMMTHFKTLKGKGILIVASGRPAAFSIYEELKPGVAVIHFEKAEKQFKGLYQIVNQESAKTIAEEGFERINREEDIGIEGLRQAKMSYFPLRLVSSYMLTISAALR